MRKITRTDVNFWLDVLLLTFFVSLCTTSVIVDFVFPAGPDTTGWRLWRWDFVQWSQLRFALLATMACTVLIHVMLHWSWVCGVVASRLGRKGAATPAKKDDPSRTLWGVGLLIFVLNVIGLIVAAAALTIQSPTGG